MIFTLATKKECKSQKKTVVMSLRWKIAQFAELRWWQNYFKEKDKNNYLNWKKTYWKKFLKDCNLDPEVNALCLDAGCGPAGIFIALENQKTDAIDPLLGAYEEKLLFFRKEYYPNINFITCDLESFPNEKKYDYVFCLNAINHVKDWKKSIKSLTQMTKTGGKLIISSDVHRFKFLKFIFRLFPGDILHPQQHSSKNYFDVLKSYEPLSLKKILLKKGNIFNYEAYIVEL